MDKKQKIIVWIGLVLIACQLVYLFLYPVEEEIQFPKTVKDKAQLSEKSALILQAALQEVEEGKSDSKADGVAYLPHPDIWPVYVYKFKIQNITLGRWEREDFLLKTDAGHTLFGKKEEWPEKIFTLYLKINPRYPESPEKYEVTGVEAPKKFVRLHKGPPSEV